MTYHADLHVSREPEGGTVKGDHKVTPLQVVSFTVAIQVAQAGTCPLPFERFPIFPLLFAIYSAFLHYSSSLFSHRFPCFDLLLLSHSRRSAPSASTTSLPATPQAPRPSQLLRTEGLEPPGRDWTYRFPIQRDLRPC